MDVAKKITELFNKKTDTSYFKILFEIILLESDKVKFDLQSNFNSPKKESQVVTQEITKTKTMEAPEVGIKKTTELKMKEESTIEITKNIIDEVKDNNTSKTMEIKTVIEDTKEIGTDEMTKLIKTAQFDVVEEKPKATSKKDEVEKRDPSFNVDDILNVLIQKDNDITMAVKSKWLNIQDKFNNKQFGKFVPLLMSGSVMFAAPNAITIYYEHIIEAEGVLKERFKKRFNDFIEEIMGSKFLVFPVNKIQFEEFKNKYQIIKNGGTNMPDPYPIIFGKLEIDLEETQELIIKEVEELKGLFDE